MTDQITLFDLPVLTLDLTDSWTFLDPYGVEVKEDKVVREWRPECPHPINECVIDEKNPRMSEECGTPIGWALAQEFLARERARDAEDE